MTATSRRASRRPVVVVVGDVLLDVDIDGRAERICPDAPVPVVDVTSELASPGGAGLTALLCADAGAEVVLVAPVSDDEGGRRLVRLLDGVRLVPLGHEGGTRTKTRIRSGGQTLLRLDTGGPGTPVDVSAGELQDALASADVVLVSDYGGLTHDETVRAVLTDHATSGTVVWDPHPRGGDPVPGAVLVTPNLSEARTAAGRTSSGRGDVAASLEPEALAALLQEAWSVRAVSVTAGSVGAFLAMPGSEPLLVPADEVASGDPCGAGDRFAATAAVRLAEGAVLSEAVVDAVAAASEWVAAGGAAAFRAGRPASRGEVVDVRDELVSAEQVVGRVRAAGGRVVATGGCFDVLHAGHVACLQAARRLGDALVVLLNSDESVRRSKGPDRPVVTAHDRAQVLLGLGCVDAVEIFDEDDPSAALERLRPDVWAKGGDYGGARLPEADVVRRHGGRVVLLPYLDGRSSTRILEASRARSTTTDRSSR